jgi:hypothetical protein
MKHTSTSPQTKSTQAAEAQPSVPITESNQNIVLPIQCKLTVGAADDPLETEADAMADKVMRMPMDNFIQRKCQHCEEEEKAQRKPLAAFIQKKETSGSSTPVSDSVSNQIASTRGSGSTLDNTTKSFMESRFGTDFSNVRIHTGQYATQLSEDLNAQAFTVGNDIYFNSGKYTPESNAGKFLLAHELTHTIQQQGIQRKIQRTSARATGPNTATVEHEGATYRVTKVVDTTTTSTTQRPRFGGGISMDNIYVNLTWCSDDLRGEITLGANIPEAARNAAQQLLSAITRGASGSELSRILRSAEATPFLEIVFAQSGEFSLTARGEVSISSEGVQGAGGSIGIRRGPVDVDVRGQGNDEGWSITANVRVTPGRSQDRHRCTSLRQRISTRFRCERLTPAHSETRTRTVTSTDTQTKYIYFNHAVATLNMTQSGPNLAAIQQLLASGYRVTQIQGFTSPEGPLGRRRGSTFMGNTQLAEARANAAQQRLQQICTTLTDTGGSCLSGVTPSVAPLGVGELYSLPDDTIEGDPLARHATGEFSTNQAEAVHRDEALMQRLQPLTAAQQADIIYPLLRRAAIVFEKETSRQENYEHPIPDRYAEVTCPEDVVNAARLVLSLTGPGRP